jgi:hypothetical protein
MLCKCGQRADLNQPIHRTDHLLTNWVLTNGKGRLMANSGFIRRQNPDSTADVICLSCFRTIAYSQAQADLAAAENNHDCIRLDEFTLLHSDKLAALQW